MADDALSLNDAQKSTAERFEKRFLATSPDALDLLYRMLHVNPDKRVTAVQALEHPYVATFHDPAVERVAEKKVFIPVEDTIKKSTAVRALISRGGSETRPA